jgi:hypothetical protein
MTDGVEDEILATVESVRAGVLKGRDPQGLCASVCAVLRGQLAEQGVGTSLVYGWANGMGHCWLEREDGTVIDPTASQFSKPDGQPMPIIYIGARPEWYKERGRYLPL